MTSHAQVVIAAPDRHDVVFGVATMGLRKRIGQPVHAVEDAVRSITLLAVDEVLEVRFVVESAEAMGRLGRKSFLEQARWAEVFVPRYG